MPTEREVNDAIAVLINAAGEEINSGSAFGNRAVIYQQKDTGDVIGHVTLWKLGEKTFVEFRRKLEFSCVHKPNCSCRSCYDRETKRLDHIDQLEMWMVLNKVIENGTGMDLGEIQAWHYQDSD